MNIERPYQTLRTIDLNFLKNYQTFDSKTILDILTYLKTHLQTINHNVQLQPCSQINEAYQKVNSELKENTTSICNLNTAQIFAFLLNLQETSIKAEASHIPPIQTLVSKINEILSLCKNGCIPLVLLPIELTFEESLEEISNEEEEFDMYNSIINVIYKVLVKNSNKEIENVINYHFNPRKSIYKVNLVDDLLYKIWDVCILEDRIKCIECFINMLDENELKKVLNHFIKRSEKNTNQEKKNFSVKLNNSKCNLINYMLKNADLDVQTTNNGIEMDSNDNNFVKKNHEIENLAINENIKSGDHKNKDKINENNAKPLPSINEDKIGVTHHLISTNENTITESRFDSQLLICTDRLEKLECDEYLHMNNKFHTAENNIKELINQDDVSICKGNHTDKNNTEELECNDKYSNSEYNNNFTLKMNINDDMLLFFNLLYIKRPLIYDKMLNLIFNESFYTRLEIIKILPYFNIKFEEAFASKELLHYCFTYKPNTRQSIIKYLVENKKSYLLYFIKEFYNIIGVNNIHLTIEEHLDICESNEVHIFLFFEKLHLFEQSNILDYFLSMLMKKEDKLVESFFYYNLFFKNTFYEELIFKYIENKKLSFSLQEFFVRNFVYKKYIEEFNTDIFFENIKFGLDVMHNINTDNENAEANQEDSGDQSYINDIDMDDLHKFEDNKTQVKGSDDNDATNTFNERNLMNEKQSIMDDIKNNYKNESDVLVKDNNNKTNKETTLKDTTNKSDVKVYKDTKNTKIKEENDILIQSNLKKFKGNNFKNNYTRKFENYNETRDDKITNGNIDLENDMKTTNKGSSDTNNLLTEFDDKLDQCKMTLDPQPMSNFECNNQDKLKTNETFSRDEKLNNENTILHDENVIINIDASEINNYFSFVPESINNTELEIDKHHDTIHDNTFNSKNEHPNNNETVKEIKNILNTIKIKETNNININDNESAKDNGNDTNKEINNINDNESAKDNGSDTNKEINNININDSESAKDNSNDTNKETNNININENELINNNINNQRKDYNKIILNPVIFTDEFYNKIFFILSKFMQKDQLIENLENYCKNDFTLINFLKVLSPEDIYYSIHYFKDINHAIHLSTLISSKREIFDESVCKYIINKMEENDLPSLFMRTVIISLLNFDTKDFTVDLMHRLVKREIWKDVKLFRGFIKCLTYLGNHVSEIIMPVPEIILKEILSDEKILNLCEKYVKGGNLRGRDAFIFKNTVYGKLKRKKIN
ncbi:hypothetical protein COBT_001827 [Conglomerata obtusa]